MVWDPAWLAPGSAGPTGLWAAARATLAEDDPTVDVVVVVDRPHASLVWDAETLGSPRAAVHDGDVADLLRLLAVEDAHTWAGVLAGRYAVGTPASYLVARATRGLVHVALAGALRGSGLTEVDRDAWSGSACARLGLPADVLDDVLPDLVPAGEVATSDPACTGSAVRLQLQPPRT